MAKLIDSSDLRDMSLSDLKKHAKQLRRSGYPISGYSKLSDIPDDKSKLRKMIRHAQKAGKASGSHKKASPKASSPKSECNSGFDNITHCQKKSSAKKVRSLAEDCGLDMDEFNTKTKQCEELMKRQKKSSSSKKKKTPTKTTVTALKNTDAYKKLDKLKKKDDKNPDLQDKARELKITYGDQDGDNISMGKLRKHELILAILKKKGVKTPTPKKSKTPTPKKSKTPTPPMKKKSKKKKSKTPTPPMKKKSKKKKSKTPTPPMKKKSKTPTPPMKKKSKKKKSKTPTPPMKKKSKKTFTGRKIIGVNTVLNDTNPTTLPDPWSEEGLKRKKLIQQVALATGRSKSFYKDWTSRDLRDRLEGLEIEDARYLTKSNEQAMADELEARRIMINDIISITGEKSSVYKGYNFDEVMDRFNQLYEDQEIEEEMSSDDEPIIKKKTPTPVSSSEDDSSDDEPIIKKKIPTLVSDEDESDRPDEDESSDESDRPDEDTEVVDVESTLANVIAGQKKIGELANVQRSILKCMGLLS
jgi:hypothetical protein